MSAPPTAETPHAPGLSALLLVLLAGWTVSASAAAQSGVTVIAKGDVPKPVVDLPELPKILALSPRNTMLFTDRDEVTPASNEYPPGYGPTSVLTPPLVDAWVSATLTGTGMSELIQYQLPSDYYKKGGKRPLLVAWHGFGSSAKSVAAQTTLDEQCDSWGWIYLAVTGIDDKLFGAPAVQQNAEAAIRWISDKYSVDPDRVYLVGFSMGAGIVANFAARHRDPKGLMIAGVGLVSGSYDWTTAYHEDKSVQPWLENTWNFGGSPMTVPFAYQRSSDLYFDPTTYPPTPGVCLDLLAMARNLHGTPVYITWDLKDTLTYLPAQSETLGKLLSTWGDDVTLRPVSGTLNPKTGGSAPHSWAVLDEEELMNTLAPLTATRVPAKWSAQLGETGAVAFAGVTQRTPGTFTRLSGGLDDVEPRLWVHDVENASEVSVDAGLAGLAGRWPLRVQASSADKAGFVLRLQGFDTPPSYLLQTADGSLVEPMESDPLSDALMVTVPGGGSVDVLVHSVPWNARLWVAPDPAAPGGQLSLHVESVPGGKLAWVILGVHAHLMTLAGSLQIMVPPVPPALLIAIPLDAAGGAVVEAKLPEVAGLSGLSLLMQAVIQHEGHALGDVSNAFRFDIQ